MRELQNVLAALAVRAPRRGVVPPSALPPAFGLTSAAGSLRLGDARRTFEERFIRAALARTGGHRARAAEELGLSRQGLAKLMSRLQISAVTIARERLLHSMTWEECMRSFNWTAAFLLLLASTAVAADDDIRLSGCLVRGHNGEGYLVTNFPGEAAWQRAADATVVPGPVGTSGTVSSILYWLEKKDGLDDHVGHNVEIEGKLLGNLQDGQIEVTPRDEWTELEIESDGSR